MVLVTSGKMRTVCVLCTSQGGTWIKWCESTARWEAAVLMHRHGNHELSWEMAPAAKPGDLSSIPRTHTVKGRTDFHMQGQTVHMPFPHRKVIGVIGEHQ